MRPLLVNVLARITTSFVRSFFVTFAGLLMLCLVLCLTSCANQSTHRDHAFGAEPTQPTIRAKSAPAQPTLDGEKQRLGRLWQERSASMSYSDLPLGPGDILRISVPDLLDTGVDEDSKTSEPPEANDEYQISGAGSFAFPLIGEVPAEGVTTQELKSEMVRRLHKYLRDPQVEVFVSQYRSREAGVFGAVAKPGVYDLTGPRDTLRDVLSQAGGPTVAGGSVVVFSPIEWSSSRTTQLDDPAIRSDVLLNPFGLRESAVIHLDDSVMNSFLSMPARPGDLLVVPSIGQVLVDGWVSKPGSYPITPGLKVLGAVVAAGGALYPAETNEVKLLRKAAAGSQTVLAVNLDQVERGEAQDVGVEDGDVIKVESSSPKLVPYGIYMLFTEVLHIGAYAAPTLP